MKKPIQFLVAIITLALIFCFQNCSPVRNSAENDDQMGLAGDLIIVSKPTFTYTWSDPNNLLPTYKAGILSNLQAAANLWAAHINSTASIQVFVEVKNNGGVLGGRSAFMVGTGKYINGRQIAEESAAYELRTLSDPNGSDPDIIITVDPTYIKNEVWIDPTPTARTDPSEIPYNKIDGVSVFLHEIGHSLGFNGWWVRANQQPTDPYWVGNYDRFITLDASGKAYFNGANAMASYGGKKIPLCVSINFHMGNIGSTDILSHMLMTGNYFFYGYRYNIDAITLAVLKDLGLPVR